MSLKLTGPSSGFLTSTVVSRPGQKLRAMKIFCSLQLGVAIGILSGFLAFFVTISFYSEMELKILEIVKKRLSVTGDIKLANLIANTQKTTLSRLKKNDLADCVALFGNDARQVFNDSVTAQDVTWYGNMITQRHGMAHNDEGQMVDWTAATLSLGDVEKGLAAAERLIAAFEAAIQ